MHHDIYNSTVSVTMTVPALNGDSAKTEECSMCGSQDVEFRVSIDIESFKYPPKVRRA